ncbi:uncharacterized protein EURHEDRAFT_273248 [Aspergillus ruber CBS 135680]|uniref:Uncharacterized protein n=1 Tax=Aspergillus ruber (strain CBS 135680) TaxID=1388766 RepID=A0A017SPM2_ASPRC|nr:uncharacterized protein EURHEDRAFT_273248 [Aspergillus ruber CBS 135680]EYE98215.1 hypothetical protein EURHEDRAFT_273248 [Aspergillus ruber CBS 135680]
MKSSNQCFFSPRTRTGLQILKVVVSRCDGVTLKRRELWRNWRLVWCLICISVAWSVFFVSVFYCLHSFSPSYYYYPISLQYSG